MYVLNVYVDVTKFICMYVYCYQVLICMYVCYVDVDVTKFICMYVCM